MELETNTIMMQNQLKVLKALEDQLKESVEDIEVDGTFVSSLSSSDLQAL